MVTDLTSDELKSSSLNSSILVTDLKSYELKSSSLGSSILVSGKDYLSQSTSQFPEQNLEYYFNNGTTLKIQSLINCGISE